MVLNDKDVLASPRNSKEGLIDWMAHEEETLVHAVLKHIILIELIMILFRVAVLVFLIAHPRLLTPYTILAAIVTSFITKSVLTRISRSR